MSETEMIARLQAALRSLCERCQSAPQRIAFECSTHNQWCHESGVDGWGHYRCALGAAAELLALCAHGLSHAGCPEHPVYGEPPK